MSGELRDHAAAGTSGRRGPAASLVKGLGWFSLGLGTTQIIRPGALNRLIGAPDDSHSRLVQRMVGLQELSAAAGILGKRAVRASLVGRTAGDIAHIAMVGRTFDRQGSRPARLAATLASLAGTFAADAFASTQLAADAEPASTNKETRMKGTATITVSAPLETAEQRWREFEQRTDDIRLGPIEIVSEQPGGGITWRTRDGEASGTAQFTAAPGDRGTEVHLELEYDAPGGAVGQVVQKIAGDDRRQMAQDDLRRFKQLLETGEIARSDGAPMGHSAEAQPKQRPAQPLEHANA